LICILSEGKKLTKDLGCKTNIEVINQFIALRDKYVIDAGCGDMTFTRLLVENGARVLAIDPDPVQAKLNRNVAPVENLEFAETGAESLPVADCSVDGVFFAYSLHHVPAESYGRVFAEILRVLKPEGILYVIEPVDCPWNEVMKLFHNEDRERAAAQTALHELAVPFFQSSLEVTYHNWSQYDSWDAFVKHFSSRSFNSLYSETDVRRPEVKEAFDRLGGHDHRFQSPKLVIYLQGLKKSETS
jgi:ubiquinone/menaquinone biosynthesis C-methylase UbiE